MCPIGTFLHSDTISRLVQRPNPKSLAALILADLMLTLLDANDDADCTGLLLFLFIVCLRQVDNSYSSEKVF